MNRARSQPAATSLARRRGAGVGRMRMIGKRRQESWWRRFEFAEDVAMDFSKVGSAFLLVMFRQTLMRCNMPRVGAERHLQPADAVLFDAVAQKDASALEPQLGIRRVARQRRD